ncbi:MAG: hypothetical protein CBC55_02650 [Gammaproteobacteria bacterium TMED95]|nr:MAG: hypothetical protein CBC55_02650 [Gammaproteobacteria bacterium TMED95]|tara:strand:+ start:4759 stop:5265 length:507 start_codon:yes stop_codon:yes gene_type:complete
MKGINYEEKRDRWRCFHRRGNKALQPRFATEREAFWKKIEFCMRDHILPFAKNKKEGAKLKGSRALSNLPVGVRAYFSEGKQAHIVISSWTDENGAGEKYYHVTDMAKYEETIRKAAWLRFEKNWEYTLRAAEKFPPVNKTLLEKLRVNAERKLARELSDAFIKNLYW